MECLSNIIYRLKLWGSMQTKYNPFYFQSGNVASTVSDLIATSHEVPYDGAYHLAEGHFESWLYYIGRHDLAKIANIAVNMMFSNGSSEAENRKIRLNWFLDNICFDRKLSHKGLEYLIHVPLQYPDHQEIPTLLFLHGAGERGSDFSKIKKQAPVDIVSRDPDFPFILIVPQCPENSYWRRQLDHLHDLIIETSRLYPIDKKRFFLTGFSMGGNAAWLLGEEYPELFAALVPCCGGGDPGRAYRLKNTPVWAFHGEKDPLVPVSQTIEMVDAVRASQGNARLTLYPETGHDCWTQAYHTPELYRWLMEQHL